MEKENVKMGLIKKLLIKEKYIDKEYIKNKAKNFWKDEDGMGVVEIILIIIVLIGLVIIFKKQITGLVKTILDKITSQANQI